jgi:hypothetical protein
LLGDYSGGLVAILDWADKLRFVAQDYLGSAQDVLNRILSRSYSDGTTSIGYTYNQTTSRLIPTIIGGTGKQTTITLGFC